MSAPAMPIPQGTVYKFLRYGQFSPYGKGRWRKVTGPLVPCRNGLHGCTREQLDQWVDDELWLLEVDPSLPVLVLEDKIVSTKARITKQVVAWNERTARLWAADCAEHVLPYWTPVYPDDDRPARVITVARQYARGKASADELVAAHDAAYAAAVTAYDGVAANAAKAAAYAASSSSAACSYAPVYAACSYADAYAGDALAERQWQTWRLLDYVEGRAG